MSCVSFITMPDMKCSPEYSIKRLPTDIPSILDTTDLTEFYGYTTDDFLLSWNYVKHSVTVDAPTDNPESSSGCDVSSPVDRAEYDYISWLEDVEDKQGDRLWIRAFTGCVDSPNGDPGDAPGSDSSPSIPAPVAYATNKPAFLPAPVFNPNQFGGLSEKPHRDIMIGRVTSVSPDDQIVSVALIAIDASANSGQPVRLVETGEIVDAWML